MNTTNSMDRLWVPAVAIAVTVAGGALTACGDNTDQPEESITTDDEVFSDSTPPEPEPVIDPGDGGEYAPELDPDDVVEVIDNPYLPLTPGNRWVYEGPEGTDERVEVEVTEEQREVMGIDAVVVRDTEYEDGEIVEDTYDWFAQDSEGNVWYLGEDTAEYEDGEVVNTAGAWEAGVDGALPGIVMPADPAAGDAHRQEYYQAEAEDMGQVLEVGVQHTIALDEYDDVLVMVEWSPLEPDVVENKYFAPGVGLIQAVKTEGGTGGEELVELTPAD